jgi:DNA adenine methylase
MSYINDLKLNFLIIIICHLLHIKLYEIFNCIYMESPFEMIGSGMRAPFPRLGGKSSLKKKILKLFPKDYKIYVEPFVGAGHLLYEKPISEVEIINDKDKYVTSVHKLFKKYDGIEITKIINGKYSKKKWQEWKDFKPKNNEERAIKYLIVSKMSFRSVGGFNLLNKTIKTNYDNRYKDRLQNVIIMNQDYKTIIKKFDSPETFFYLDPPYENSYEYEHNDVNPVELCNILSNIKGKFLLSYNDSENIRSIFKQYNIKTVEVLYASSQGQNVKRNELLIRNL